MKIVSIKYQVPIAWDVIRYWSPGKSEESDELLKKAMKILSDSLDPFEDGDIGNRIV